MSMGKLHNTAFVSSTARTKRSLTSSERHDNTTFYGYGQPNLAVGYTDYAGLGA